MNRRRFFVRSALATGALLSIPGLTRAVRTTECTTRIFKGSKTVKDGNLNIRLELCPEILEHYKTAPKEDKQVVLNLFPNEAEYYEATYTISGVKKGTDGTLTVSCTYMSATAKLFKLPADFNKLKLSFRMKKDDQGMPLAELLDLKGQRYALLEMERPAGEDEECYLTTACVREQGKSDQCEELQVLRQFRDQYLRRLPEGESLVQAYYQHAPSIVQAINARPDHAEIYRRLYRDMIRPAVELIHKGRHAEAERCYRNYTEQLYRFYVSREIR